MKVISLFSGIGGFDLALERLGHTTVAYSEIDPWACDVMRARFPTAVNLGDITTIDWSHIERPDILCGGFPCQPHSVAGKRAGAADARDLWPECVRALRELRPRLALFENVRGLLSSGGGGVFNRCLSDLAEIGYDASWQVLSAAAVGAPHRRERVWIVAYPVGERGCGGNGQRQDATDAESPGVARSSALAALADRDGRGQRGSKIPQDFDPSHRDDADGRGGATRWPTPRTEDGESTGISAERRARGVADNLPSAVWATPNTSQGGPDHARANRDGSGGDDLVTQVNGKLNPDWVETLMGFPVGWTNPDVPNDQLVWTPFPAGPGPQYDWEPPRVTTRKDGRRKRLRCLGNAIVPACLEAILTGGLGEPVGPNVADAGRRGDGAGQPERKPRCGDSALARKGGPCPRRTHPLYFSHTLTPGVIPYDPCG